MKRPISRRYFLRAAGAVGAVTTVLEQSASAWAAPANEKLRIALIGVGGRGTWFVNTIPNAEKVVALCDVNEDKAGRAREKHPKLPFFHDYRRMLDQMDREIDAVIIAAPDHIHAPAAAAAMKRGKHVYCEKPLTRTVGEARALRAMAREQKAITQMGNQGTASGAYRRGVELIQEGAIGPVKHVHVWKDSGGRDHKNPPHGEKEIPFYLKWNLWLGPAAERPFHPSWLGWHNWRDFGTCQLGNWATHSTNLAFRALRIDSLWFNKPGTSSHLRIKAKVSRINRISFPRWEVIDYQIPARGDLPPFTLTWHNGQAPGSRDLIENTMKDGLDWGDKKGEKWADHAGTLIVGGEGMIQSNGHNTVMRLLPEEKFKEVQCQRPESLPRSRGHEAEWLQACRGGAAAWSNFDYAGPLTEFLMLGNLATQFEEEIVYDPVAGRIVNHPAANQALDDHRRDGWKV